MTTAEDRVHRQVVGLLPGPEPTGPDVLPIQALHRHSDGVISFHCKTASGEFRNLFAVRAEHLASMFPEMRAQLEADSYYSVNAFWHREHRKRYLDATESRQRDRLRYLCACYTDIDSYRAGVDFGTALGMVVSYQDQGVIPPASVIVRSGQGLWLLWLLRDHHNPAMPARAWPEKVRLYCEINRAAGERLARIGADAAARDCLRLTRVPGSVHTGAGRRTKYWIQLDERGQSATYTLDELAEAFGVDQTLTSTARRAFAESTLPPGSHLRGHAQLNARRLREFEVLRSVRGGAFVAGHRNHAALVYAWLLRRSGADRETVLREVEALGRKCRPALDESSVRGAVKSAFGRGQGRIFGIWRLRDQTIADWLHITPAEADLLERMPCASHFRSVDVTVVDPLSPERRRRLIRDHIDRAGGAPTCRRMAELLAADGYAISRQQVLRDYRAMAIQTGREKSEALMLIP